MRERLQHIADMNELAKKRLTDVLKEAGYDITKDEYHKEAFGYRFYVWTNNSTGHLFRLIWDGRDDWFVLQENWLAESKRSEYWEDIKVLPFDDNRSDEEYFFSLIEEIEKEIKNTKRNKI